MIFFLHYRNLKATTAAARSFRSAECEYRGPWLSYIGLADRRQDEFATSAWRQGRLPYAGTTLNDLPNPTSTEFDQYLGTTAGIPFQNQRWAQQRQFPARQPYMNHGPSSLLHTTSNAGAESSHAQSASETTIEANRPSSPGHDSANADQIE